MLSRLALALLTLVGPAADTPPGPAAPAPSPAGRSASEVGVAFEKMTQIISNYSPSLSPDGKQVAFINSISGVAQIWIADTDKPGKPRQVGSFEDAVTNVDWSPDGKWLAASVADQVYVLHPDGSGLQRITAGGKESNRLSGWSGRFVRYRSSHDTPGSLEPWIWDSASGTSRKVATSSGFANATDVSQDGKQAVFIRLVTRGTDDNIFLVDLTTGKEVLLTPHTSPALYGGGKFSPDGSVIYISSDQDLDNLAFAKIVLGKDGSPGPIQNLVSRPDGTVDTMAVASNGSRAALSFNVAGRSELVLVDLATLRQTPIPLPGETLDSLTFSQDGKRLAFAITGPKLPNDIWMLDVGSGEVRQITFSRHEGVDLDKLVSAELVRFPAHDGLQLSGWLYRAPGGKPGPVVINIHGGPQVQERPFFSATYQSILSRGISVFAPNIRGSSGFGKKFLGLDDGPLRVEAVKDIKDCADFLIQSGIADPKRIGVMGGAYGGFMVLSALAEFPDLFAAGVDIAGISNLETYFRTEFAAIYIKEYADPNTQRDLLRQLSPIHKVDRIKTPLLLIHNEKDPILPVAEPREIADRLQKRGIPVQLTTFDDETRGVQRLPNRIRITTEVVQWLERYLKAGSELTQQGGHIGPPHR
jgi:dipeptidyl aminopeptidase/acylaminoacyl peptidase